MFEAYYGLAEKPFNLTPDTDFFYHNLSHQEALNMLIVGIQSGEGFIKVTGEVGTGKTLICRKLLEELKEGFQTIYIPNPFMDTEGLLKAIADELEVDVAQGDNVLNVINSKLLENAENGIKSVLILDEAQSVPNDSLEAIRLLSNLETKKHKLIHIILFGQQELNDKLENSSIRQLQQRIMHHYELSPLSINALKQYIECRLQKAGYYGPEIFSESALKLAFKVTHGIPRLINIIASKAMLCAYAKGDFYVADKHIKMALDDTEFSKNLNVNNWQNGFYWIAALIILAIFIVLSLSP